MSLRGFDSLKGKGISDTHIQLLQKFLVLSGQEITQSSMIRGQKGHAPIPPDSIVKEPHYLHNLIRGVYKPNNDPYALSIQTNPDSKWGAEVDFEAGRWSIEYDFGANGEYRQDIESLNICHRDSIPIGVIYKVGRGVNRILGLGMIKSVVGTKFLIVPYVLDENATTQVAVAAKSLALDEVVRKDFSSRGGKRTVLGRQKMKWFRDQLLLEYGGRCAFCGLTIGGYLIASHIVRYSTMQKEDPTNAMNPSNGLLLCQLCDIAFERGDLRVDPGLNVIISSNLLRRAGTDAALKTWLGLVTKKIISTGKSGYPPAEHFIKRKEELTLEKHTEGFDVLRPEAEAQGPSARTQNQVVITSPSGPTLDET